MKTVLFIPYHLESHIRPTITLSRLLSKAFRIVYAVPQKFKSFAETHHLDYVILESVPFGSGFESVIRKQEGSKHAWRDALNDRRNRRIAKHREKKLKEITDTLQPVFIFLDMLSSTDFILLYPYLESNNAGIAIINPMLSTHVDKGVPGIGSLLNPKQTFKLVLENLFVRSMYHLFHGKEWIRWLGNDNRSLIKREFRKKQVHEKYRLSKKNYTTNFFNEIPELILAPEELEFPGKSKRNNQYYIGLLPAAGTAVAINEQVHDELLQQIISWKKNTHCRIIFCAFGSMYGNASDIIYSFLARLFSIKTEEFEWQIICAFADKKSRFDKNALPANVHLYNWLPQTQLLPYCDLFITHAGLGSVKEAIAAKVPMLAYPFTRHWDSTGNAVKVEYHGLGLKGDIEKDSSATIKEKIVTLLNEPVFKENIQRLNKRVTEKYSVEQVSELFEILGKKRLG